MASRPANFYANRVAQVLATVPRTVFGRPQGQMGLRPHLLAMRIDVSPDGVLIGQAGALVLGTLVSAWVSRVGAWATDPLTLPLGNRHCALEPLCSHRLETIGL